MEDARNREAIEWLSAHIPPPHIRWQEMTPLGAAIWLLEGMVRGIRWACAFAAGSFLIAAYVTLLDVLFGGSFQWTYLVLCAIFCVPYIALGYWPRGKLRY